MRINPKIINSCLNCLIGLLRCTTRSRLSSFLAVLSAFVSYGLFAPFDLDKHLRGMVLNDLGMRDNTLSVAVSRLVKKDCIKKAGKSFYLNPAFNNLDDVDQIAFKFMA